VCVSRFRAEREEHDEICVPEMACVIFAVPLVEVRVGNQQFGFGEIFAVGVRIDQCLKIESSDLVPPMFDVFDGPVIQHLSGWTLLSALVEVSGSFCAESGPLNRSPPEAQPL